MTHQIHPHGLPKEVVPVDWLREQKAIAKLERYDAELEDLDFGGVLAFAERTLGAPNDAQLELGGCLPS